MTRFQVTSVPEKVLDLESSDSVQDPEVCMSKMLQAQRNVRMSLERQISVGIATHIHTHSNVSKKLEM